MKILYLHQYFSTRQGAWITRPYELALRLIRMGHDVTVISLPGYMPDEYKHITRITRVDMDGVPVIIIPVAYSNDMGFARRMLQFVKFAVIASWLGMRQKADLVYASSTPLTIAIPGIATKLWQRVPMVFEVRDLWPRVPIAVGALKNPILIWAAGALEWIAYHSAQHVVALSPGMRQGIVERGIPENRITVIPNSCDVDLFDVPPETGQPIRDRLGLTPEQPLVVYAGSFGLLNNVGYLVDLASRMNALIPECRFLLVGSGAEFNQVCQKAQALGLLDKTVFVWSSVPKTEMPALLSAATVSAVTFLPIRAMWDNSANKFFDALAAGRPVVINYGGWQADILRETEAGIQLSDSDIDAAALALAEFLRSPERLERARQAARDLAYHRFNRDEMARILGELLVQVAGKS